MSSMAHARAMIRKSRTAGICITTVMFLIADMAAASNNNAPPTTGNIVFEQTNAPVWQRPEIPLESGLPEEAGPENNNGQAPTSAPDFYDESAWPDDDYTSLRPLPADTPSVPPVDKPPATGPDPVMDALRAEYERDRASAAADVSQGSPDSVAPSENTAPSSGMLLLRAIMGLSFVCALIILLGYVLRRYGKHTPLMAGRQLGQHLGKVHLTPRAALHFIRSGDKVLVVGLTPNAIAPITEFSAESFDVDQALDTSGTSGRAQPFVNQLRDAAQRMDTLTSQSPKPVENDLATLRSDIQRLQRHLEESSRE